MNAYSKDLRDKVLAHIDLCHTYKETSVLFGVCEKTVFNWVKLRNTTGDIEAKPVPRSPHKLLDEELLAYVKERPDAYLQEIADYFNCSDTGVMYALRRLKVTYKKTEIISRAERAKASRISAERRKNKS